jgi:hypothetical protein
MLFKIFSDIFCCKTSKISYCSQAKNKSKYSVNPFLQKASSFYRKLPAFVGLLHGYGSATGFIFLSIGQQAGEYMAACSPNYGAGVVKTGLARAADAYQKNKTRATAFRFSRKQRLHKIFTYNLIFLKSLTVSRKP